MYIHRKYVLLSANKVMYEVMSSVKGKEKQLVQREDFPPSFWYAVPHT